MFLLLALRDQLSKQSAKLGYAFSDKEKALTSSHLARVVGTETGTSASLLLLVPVLLAGYSAQGMGLVSSLSLGLGSLGLSHKEAHQVSQSAILGVRDHKGSATNCTYHCAT